MPEKIKGTVKWFSNRKGFGFVSPSTGGDDIFLHHSRIVSDADYKTLRDGFEIEFEIGNDEEGKPFADKVTAVGGTPIPPPDPATRKKKKVKPASPAEGTEEPKKEVVGESTEEGGKKKRNRKKTAPKKEVAPKKSDWYSELDEAVQKSMEEKGIKIDSGRIFISIGDARLKVGTGGYITLAHASGLVAEGKYSSGTDGKLTATWEKVLKLDGADWKASSVEAVNGALLSEIDLTNDIVKATGADEKPESLWGEGKPDPKDVLEKEGFLMRKISLTAAATPGRRGRPRNRKRGPKKGGDAAPAAAS